MSSTSAGYPDFIQKACDQVKIDLKQSIAKIVTLGPSTAYPTWELFIGTFNQSDGRMEMQIMAFVDPTAFPQLHLFVKPSRATADNVDILLANDLLVKCGSDVAASYPVVGIPVTLLEQVGRSVGNVCSALLFTSS